MGIAALAVLCDYRVCCVRRTENRIVFEQNDIGCTCVAQRISCPADVRQFGDIAMAVNVPASYDANGLSERHC